MATLPYNLIPEQTPMFKALLDIVIREALPGKRPSKNPDSIAPITTTIKAPSEKLVNAYISWSGAPASRYQDELPPHLFTQFALPVFSKQLLDTRYRLSSIINQGCDFTVKQPLKRRQDIQVRSDVIDITEDNGRARIHVRLTLWQAPCQENLIVDCYTAFIIGKGEKRKKNTPEYDFEKVGSWDVAGNDGLHFGLLTGDINPIHWIGPLAKKSVFKGKVLHGYGMMVKTFETIQQAESQPVSQFKVRFVSPVHLPSQNNQVFRETSAQANGDRALALKDSHGKLLLAGSFQ